MRGNPAAISPSPGRTARTACSRASALSELLASPSAAAWPRTVSAAAASAFSCGPPASADVSAHATATVAVGAGQVGCRARLRRLERHR